MNRCRFCRVRRDAIPNPEHAGCKHSISRKHVFAPPTPEMVMAYPQCMPNCAICQWAMLCQPNAETPLSTIGATYTCTNPDCELYGATYKIEPSIIMRKVKE